MIDARSPGVTRADIVQLGEVWADTDAAASLLENMRKSVLARYALEAGGPWTARDAEAHAHPAYCEHVAAMVESRRVATRARVAWEAAKIEADMMRSAEASRRAEMTMR